MNRVGTVVLAVIAFYMVCRVGYAALGALILGLTIGSLGATLAGVVGLGITYLLWHWVTDLVDQAFARVVGA